MRPISSSPSPFHPIVKLYLCTLTYPTLFFLQMNSLGRFMRLSRFKKLMLEAVAFSLTPAQITILRAEFNAIDTDRYHTV